MKLNDRQLDELLDQGLERYGQVQPRPGLEERIIANMRAQQSTRRFSWRWPVAALAAIAVLAAAVLIVPRKQTAIFEANGIQPILKQPQPMPHRPLAVQGTKRPVTRRSNSVRVASTAVPWLEQFPSPAPLSEQEKLLARYVQEQPEEAGKVAQALAELRLKDLELERLRLAGEPGLE